MSSEIKITNGYGMDVGPDYLTDHIFEYFDFNDAAPLIHPTWTRHHLFKELYGQRIWMSELLIVYNAEMVPDWLKVGNKKYYISRTEIERLSREYAKRPKRKIIRCGWCGRPLRDCQRAECTNRFKESPQHAETIELVAEFFNRYVNKPKSPTQNFKELSQAKRRKKRNKHNQESDNAEDGG